MTAEGSLSLSLHLALQILLAFAILTQALPHPPVQAKVVSYGDQHDVSGHKDHSLLVHRPSKRLRMVRRASLTVDMVSTLSTLIPDSTAVAEHTLSTSSQRTSHIYTPSVDQGSRTLSRPVTLTPQESEVSLWPSHVRLGSEQKDFVSWPGSGGLLALGSLGTFALLTALALRIHITSHLSLLLVTCLVLMIGASVDLSMGTIHSHSDSRSYGRCICAALAYAGATWATYAWAHLVIFQKSTAEQLPQPSPSALLTDRQTQEQHPELVRTTRLISGVLTFLIGLFEVCWRITLVRDYSIGWRLQQTSTMLQFIFLLLVGIPVARFCSYAWIECQQAGDVFHWLATSCLFIGWAVGTGRLAAAFRILGFCESPLGRLLWLLQLVCFTITAISLRVMEQRHDAEQVGEFKGVVIEKPLLCIPVEVHNGRRSTDVAAALTHRGSNEAAQAMDVTSGLSDGQPQGLALMRTPRRKQPLVEGSSAFPVPPSTPAGVPSSVYLPAETPSMYLDSMRAEYLASGPRERAISLPLNRLPTTPSSHGGGLSLSDLVMGLPKPNTSNGKLSHRGRSSSLGDALTRRTSHDTFMTMKRRYEGRAQAEKHRRARSASSDMTHLTVTSFFNQFPAPPPMLPIPFHLSQHIRGQSVTTQPSRHASRPSSTSGRGAGSSAQSRSRNSRPFTASKLGHSVFDGECLEAVSSCNSDIDQDIQGNCHHVRDGGPLHEDYRLRINSLLSMEGVPLTSDGKTSAVRAGGPAHSLDKPEVQRRPTTSDSRRRRSRQAVKAQGASGITFDIPATKNIVPDKRDFAVGMCPFPTSQDDLDAACGMERAASRATRESKGRSVTFSIEEEGGGEAAGRA